MLAGTLAYPPGLCGFSCSPVLDRVLVAQNVGPQDWWVVGYLFPWDLDPLALVFSAA
jgi:hypothetical protein